jgi:hypothetical protein
MKRTLLLLISLFFVNLIQAQQKAVTETGEEVILFEDESGSIRMKIKSLRKKFQPIQRNLKRIRSQLFY